jgi:tripeptide aminopeptidase
MPENETPATTEGYEGFYHISDITACESEATISMIIRDHDREKFENRKAFVEKLTSYMNSIYGEGTFTVQIKDSYYNMKEKILPCMHLIDNAEAAMKSCGVTPKIVPIRGGTDGARLSYEGLPCPNLSTGGENAHSIHEFIPVSALEKMTDVILELVKL